VTSTAVAKGGAAYAVAKNHQYRHEIPSNIVTEAGALNHINSTLGRTEYSRVNFPSYGYVPHPDSASAREGKLKLITLTGMTHGREARIAADYDGYHKAEAGVDAILPRLLKLPTGDVILNEELLNPAGIGIIKKKRSNFILWGDRTLHLDSNWKFAHQRELVSYYEHVLQESFDFIIFSINDSLSDKDALSALKGFFLPEWTKRALRGDTFDEAAIIKVDAELNTDAVRAAGDKKASVSLRLADTTERFEITIGKQGIFENVA
jgi:phage tail sheath protein FI